MSQLSPKPPHKTRIVAAMSGGVDSSVTAALLKRAGYDVVGITLQLYDHGKAIGKTGACCAGRDIYDARKVAESLAIPHYVLDYESRFKDSVIRDFADSYARGETPVPCIQCNSKVKFADLLATAKELGADALATGHYVRRIMGADGPELHRAADPARDQSYFLFNTTMEQLSFLRFPLGEMKKDEVREIAAELGLTVARKPDSQDICFVPEGRYVSIVEKLRPDAAVPGEIVDLDGNVLGRHNGVIHFTIGQRRGLGLSGNEEPLFVVRLDARNARVVVAPRSALRTHTFFLRGVNWLFAHDGKVECAVKVRSMRPPVMAQVTALPGNRARVDLAVAEEGVAPGQACVFYETEGSRVLGGGWITADMPDRVAA